MGTRGAGGVWEDLKDPHTIVSEASETQMGLSVVKRRSENVTGVLGGTFCFLLVSSLCQMGNVEY